MSYFKERPNENDYIERECIDGMYKIKRPRVSPIASTISLQVLRNGDLKLSTLGNAEVYWLEVRPGRCFVHPAEKISRTAMQTILGSETNTYYDMFRPDLNCDPSPPGESEIVLVEISEDCTVDICRSGDASVYVVESSWFELEMDTTDASPEALRPIVYGSPTPDGRPVGDLRRGDWQSVAAQGSSATGPGRINIGSRLKTMIDARAAAEFVSDIDWRRYGTPH